MPPETRARLPERHIRTRSVPRAGSLSHSEVMIRPGTLGRSSPGIARKGGRRARGPTGARPFATAGPRRPGPAGQPVMQRVPARAAAAPRPNAWVTWSPQARASRCHRPGRTPHRAGQPGAARSAATAAARRDLAHHRLARPAPPRRPLGADLCRPRERPALPGRFPRHRSATDFVPLGDVPHPRQTRQARARAPAGSKKHQPHTTTPGRAAGRAPSLSAGVTG
jgi:hypothetical protein